MGDCAGFKWYAGAKARGIGYEEETSPTIAVSDSHVPGVLMGRSSSVLPFKTDHLSQNGRIHDEEGIAFTVDTTNSNALVDIRFCMQDGQANGAIEEELSTTLNASHEQPIVIDRAAFNQGENAKYPPHIEQTDVMDTLVARGPHAVAFDSRTENK